MVATNVVTQRSLVAHTSKCGWAITLTSTSHTRLRARDPYTASTLVGGKRGVGPSPLHITLEGPTEAYVNAR